MHSATGLLCLYSLSRWLHRAMAPSTHQWLPDSYLISNSLLSPGFVYFIVSSPTPLGRLESIQTYHDKNRTLGLCDLLKTSSFPVLHSSRKNFRIMCLSSLSQASVFITAKSTRSDCSLSNCVFSHHTLLSSPWPSPKALFPPLHLLVL